MGAHRLCRIVLIGWVAVLTTFAPAAAEVTLTGWGLDEKDPEAFVGRAAAVGFDALITGSTSPAVLERDIAAGRKHQVAVYACLSPMAGLAGLWSKRYPGRPVPWQVMSDAEQAAFQFISAGDNRWLIDYQHGGEPRLTHEVLLYPILCLSSPEVRGLLFEQIEALARVPGLAGVAFDGFGYQNYHDCRCERCQRLLAEYRQAHPELAADQAAVACFRDLLVDCLNALAGHVRDCRADLKTALHIWPVFAPDPLYGNRLDVDYCGQTAAWYNPWPREKIAAYSRLISGQARRYHPRPQGVGMIGYYDRPGQFPVKDGARVDMELRTMIAHGCCHIQVCGTGDVLDNPDIAEVFRKRCR